MLRQANLDGTVQVFEAARRAGVRRIVYASSIHAVGFTPVADDLRADLAPRPDTLYGGEQGLRRGARALLRRPVRHAGGLPAHQDVRPSPPDLGTLSTWLSPDDCGRLVDACLRSTQLSYAIVWGISANTRRTWSLDEGLALGYQPRDDAEVYADAVPAGTSYPSAAFLGGGFTSPGFGIDEVAARS